MVRVSHDSDTSRRSQSDDVRPDEREVIAERRDSLADEASHLSLEAVLDDLDIELE